MMYANESSYWQNPYISNPYIDQKGTNQIVMAVSLPLFNQSQLLG